MVNRELATAPEGAGRIRALGRNHDLWSLLVKDLAYANNRLPDALKTQLVSLGAWSMHYSTAAILKNLPVQPLLDVNRNIVEGLQAQQARPAATDAVFSGAIAV